MEKNKEKLLIAVLAVVALSVVAGAVLFFYLRPSDKNTDVMPSVSDTTVSVQNTTTPVTTEPFTTESVTTEAFTTEALTTETQTTEALTTQAETTAPVAEETTAPPVATDETAEILKVVYDAMTLLKSDQANFTGHKVQNIDMKLVDSSIPSMNGVANGIISLFIKQKIYDYDFTNGVSADPETGGTIKSNAAFPPGDIPFTLQREGVASAEKTFDGLNTVYTVTIVHETSTLQNPRPPHHNSGADTLDLSSVEIPMVTINRVDFDYPGAQISVTISPDGKIVGYHEHLKMSGTGEVSGFGMTGFGTIEGFIDEKWDIQWK